MGLLLKLRNEGGYPRRKSRKRLFDMFVGQNCWRWHVNAFMMSDSLHMIWDFIFYAETQELRIYAWRVTESNRYLQKLHFGS